MGSLIRVWKTEPIPEGASIGRNGIVTWTVRGKKKTGKLSGTNRVSIQTDTWTAQFVDEAGKVRRVPTKTTSRAAAEKILAIHEKDIDRIKSGVITREELDKVQVKQTPLDDLVEQFRTKMTAEGCVAAHINETLRQVNVLLKVCEINTVAQIRREPIEKWIAKEIPDCIGIWGVSICLFFQICS
jgi:hypothetical protein